MHALGLVHRDVKPSNVLLTVDGPLLIDFGIARATDGTASLTSTGVSIGSPGYMSPEQILGKGITGAADVFSLGAVLAYAATGQSPFPVTPPPPSSTRSSTRRPDWTAWRATCATWSSTACPRIPPPAPPPTRSPAPWPPRARPPW